MKISLSAQPPPAKRAHARRRFWTHKKKSSDGGKQDEEIITIPCHAAILCSRSPYFDACLGAGYLEGQIKVVEISLEDNGAVDDLKLLVKQSYGASYIIDEETGQQLEKETRLRLLLLANAFELHGCLMQCMESLGEGIGFEEALDLLDELPEELGAHEEMTKLKVNVIEYWQRGRSGWRRRSRERWRVNS